MVCSVDTRVKSVHTLRQTPESEVYDGVLRKGKTIGLQKVSTPSHVSISPTTPPLLLSPSPPVSRVVPQTQTHRAKHWRVRKVQGTPTLPLYP